MEQNSYLKLFVRYSSLNVLGAIGLSCYFLADTFFIAKGMGTKGLAALNIAIPAFSLMNGSGLMLGMGGATKYSIFKGQGSAKNANAVFTNTLYLAAFFSALFVAAGFLFSDKIALALGADEAIFDMTEIYLRVILLFSPAFVMNNLFISFVRNDGQPQLAMLAMLVGSFFNIIMDYVFIFPLDMGIFGAVLATGCSPIVSLMVLSTHMLRGNNQFHFTASRPSFSMGRSLMLLGLPSLFSELSSGIVMIVFNYLILSFAGNTGVAAYGVIANISLVVVAVYTGISQGIQPLLSRSCGQNDLYGIRQVLRYAIITLLAVSAVIYAFIFSFAAPITEVFNSEGSRQMAEIAVPGLRLYFTAVPFVGFNIIMSVFFTSTDRPLPAHIITLLRGMILVVPMAFLLSFAAGMNGLWLTFPATEGLVALFGVMAYKKVSKK